MRRGRLLCRGAKDGTEWKEDSQRRKVKLSDEGGEVSMVFCNPDGWMEEWSKGSAVKLKHSLKSIRALLIGHGEVDRKTLNVWL